MVQVYQSLVTHLCPPCDPVHNRDYSYFMDHFKNSFHEGKNYHELIKEQKCRYVHDVQHYLMDEFGEDDLKIHHIL